MHSLPRSSQRRPLSLMVKSRVQSRVVYVDMIDISEGGCKIRATRGFAKNSRDKAAAIRPEKLRFCE